MGATSLSKAGRRDYDSWDCLNHKFGPDHPCKSGRDGLSPFPGNIGTSLPGFGPYGTAGCHCFNEQHPAFLRIAALAALRSDFPALRNGRQYLRQTRFLGNPFGLYGPGEIAAWSRVLDDEETLCVANPHGAESRGADVIVDATLNPAGSSMTVVLNTAQAANPAGYAGTHKKGSKLRVKRTDDGTAYVELRGLGPSEVVVVANYPGKDIGGIAA